MTDRPSRSVMSLAISFAHLGDQGTHVRVDGNEEGLCLYDTPPYSVPKKGRKKERKEARNEESKE